MSKEIFEKNVSAMEKWYPSFAEMIREREPEDEVEIGLETSWDGEKVFRIQKEDKKLYLGGKRNAKKLEHTGSIPQCDLTTSWKS